MKPIISPWLLYLIDLIYNLKDMLDVVLIVLECASVALLLIWFLYSMLDGYEKDNNVIIACKKHLKKLVILICVISLLCTAFPSKDTMYKMLMLENVTTDNIQVVGKTDKYVVDYIVDQIDKEENEK